MLVAKQKAGSHLACSVESKAEEQPYEVHLPIPVDNGDDPWATPRKKARP